MEVSDRRNKRGKKSPRVPIKTYHWEEVRRSRRQGGYPWTHLYKEPFYEHLDPEPWTMEGMRKAKSSSTMGKSEDMSISEVSTFENRSSMEEIFENPSLDAKNKNHSIKTSCSSLNLEEQEIEDDDDVVKIVEVQYEVIDKDEADEKVNQNPGMFFLHSEESSDDISQYLDKEEHGPTEKADNHKTADTLKPEEETSRKRKLSAGSSSSKLSQGKEAILQKLKATKDKIKVPKVSFHTKLKKPTTKKQKNSPPQVKKSVTKTQPPKEPVYIHIPLKPPPGQSDEFSHLEKETEKKQPAATPTKKPASFRDLVKNIKHLEEPKIETKHPSPIKEVQEEEIEESFTMATAQTETSVSADTHMELVETSAVKEPTTVKDSSAVKEPTTVKDSSAVKEPTTVKDSSVVKEPTTVKDSSAVKEPTTMKDLSVIKELTTVKDSSAVEEPPVVVLEGPSAVQQSSAEAPLTITEDNSKPVNNDFFDKLFEASSSRPASLHFDSRKLRSKSAEPERKRKLSLESSYSRKSLSKLGLMKKLRDAKDKIKTTLSRVTPKKEIKPKPEPAKPVEKPKSQLKPSKKVEPVYIHIPLKPPEGQTDEYSHFEHETRPKAPPSVEVAPKEQEDSPTETPGNVQFIMLTAPSDDEILDYPSSDVPETPSSENKLFFPVKITELKELAKGAIDEVTGSSIKLTTVSEEVQGSVEDIGEKILEDEQKIENMMVDEEDGLNETKKQEAVVEEIKVEEKDIRIVEESAPVVMEEAVEVIIEHEEVKSEDIPSEEKHELKSVLKSPNSPVMKKKVSFKRKSKNKQDSESEKDKNDDIVSSVEEVVFEADRSEEKDDNNWSKISDHNDADSEPVSPPANMTLIPTVTLNDTPAVVIDTEAALGPPEQQNYDFTTKHLYEEIAEGSSKPLKSQVFAATTDNRSSESADKPKEGPSKFQIAFRQKADNLKSKFQNMKKPHINLQKPNLQRFKMEKPKWTMPKIPDTAKINLPNFSLPRKKTVKRISSTESTSGDSKKPMFDFGTYPRIFRKKPKPDAGPDFSTVPRAKKTDSSKSTEDSRVSSRSTTDSIRIPLHSEDSMEKDDFNMPGDAGVPSHLRYSENIDSEDEYLKESKEIMEERDFLSRWERGRFNQDELNGKEKITDLDSPEQELSSNGKDQRYSSESPVGVHRQGVLEEINPDEFFLRQKGISQDNIEVGMYLSTEIREAFRNPANALLQMADNSFDAGSHHSLPEITSKRKPVRKPKRKKTPHASQEQIPYGEEETPDDEELETSPPSRPRRRSKRKKKTTDEFIPYQETIPVEVSDDRLTEHRDSLGILADDEQEFLEQPEEIEELDIKISNPYKDYGEEELQLEEEEEEYIPPPQAPPRNKPKTKKSLHMLEIGSTIQTFDEINIIPSVYRVPERISYHTKELQPDSYYPEELNLNMNIMGPGFMKEYNINMEYPKDVLDDQDFLEEKINRFEEYRYMDESIDDFPPAAPPRKQKSVKSLTISENESLPGDLSANKVIFSSEKNLDELQIDAIRTESKIIIPIEPDIPPPPPRPARSRSRGNLKSRTASLAATESHPDLESISLEEPITVEPEPCLPCVEEPCQQVICDYMGYSTVDRSKPRQPPLPPPRSLQRKKKGKKNQKNNFSTVPRRKRSVDEESVPVRPSRIYSTLGPGPKSDIEDKENIEIDILQYIEQDANIRDLQSGEVIEKIKARPLPAPPRPPRHRPKSLSDISSRENIMSSTPDVQKETVAEVEVYTQTEPLPDDFVCEEMVEEPTDRVIIPTQAAEKPQIEQILIIPSIFTHQETITHGSLLVEPMNGATLLPASEFTQVPKEHVVQVKVESDHDETSSIPDDFHKLADPEGHNQPTFPEMDVLKAHKLQITDLDVDTLTVNKLLADKIVVSEIDTSNIQTNEISSRSGALRVGEIALPPEILDQLLKKLQSSQTESIVVSETLEEQKEELVEEKKTPIFYSPVESELLLTEKATDALQSESSEIGPVLANFTGTIQLESSEVQLALEKPIHTPNLQTSEAEVVLEVSSSETALIEDVESTFSSVMVEGKKKLPKPEDVSPEPLAVTVISNDSTLVENSSTLDKKPPAFDQNLSSPSTLVENPPTLTENPSAEETSLNQNSLLLEPSLNEYPPLRPPRQSGRLKSSQSITDISFQEPDVDDEPPPRPPEPPMGYIPSQPPSSFYALRAQKYVDDNIPVVPRRKRHTKTRPLSRSSSDESLDTVHVRRHHRRSSEPSIGELSGQLVRACGSAANNALKRLINYILKNIFNNEDGKQDLNVMIIIVLVLIAGLLLLGYGEDRTVVHLHHWDYFNPPKDM